jgi:hypothetical protein
MDDAFHAGARRCRRWRRARADAKRAPVSSGSGHRQACASLVPSSAAGVAWRSVGGWHGSRGWRAKIIRSSHRWLIATFHPRCARALRCVSPMSGAAVAMRAAECGRETLSAIPTCGRSSTSVRVPGRAVRRGRRGVERSRALRFARLLHERRMLASPPARLSPPSVVLRRASRSVRARRGGYEGGRVHLLSLEDPQVVVAGAGQTAGVRRDAVSGVGWRGIALHTSPMWTDGHDQIAPNGPAGVLYGSI